MIKWKEFSFEAAHQLLDTDIYDYGHHSEIHGHSYKLQVGVEGYINSETHMLINSDFLEQVIKEEIIDKFNHTFLNESMSKYNIDETHATCERLIGLFRSLIEKRIINDENPNIHRIRIKLWETPTIYCEL